MVVEFARMDACSLLEETEKAVSNAVLQLLLSLKTTSHAGDTHSLDLFAFKLLLYTPLHLPAGPTSYTTYVVPCHNCSAS